MVEYKQFKQELFDYEFIEYYIEDILSVNDYIPRVFIIDETVRGVMFKKGISRKDIFKDDRLNQMCTRQHGLENFASNRGEEYKILFDLTNLLIFIELYPQFEKIVDDDVLEYWVDYFEKNFSVDVLKYTGSYEDIRPVIKKGELEKC